MWDTSVSMLTGHGRATPLLWKTVASSTLKGNQRRYEYEVLCRDRRDRLLLVSALAIAVLSILGAAGERIGYDRWLKANTVKRRTHSLFRQGLMLYHHLPNWPEDRIRPLMETFGSMLMEQRVYREVFGVL